MKHFIFNLADGNREQATAFLRAESWVLGSDERHCDSLAAGDLVLIHVAKPRCEFIGHARLASAFRDWTPLESDAFPYGRSSGVLLADVHEWRRSVPLDAVVHRIDPTASNLYVQGNAAGFRSGIVLITAEEYAAALALNRETVLAPMTESEFVSFVATAIPAYADDKVRSGQWASEQSLELSRTAFDELLPQGRDTADNHLFTVLDDGGRAVGTLWLAVKEQAGKHIGYIYDVRIQPEFRRGGHATRALNAVEDEARKLGLSGIALHVFGHNVGARALYEAVGYKATNINMFKAL